MRRVDLVNTRIGKLLVIKRAEMKGKHQSWLCKCDCGNTVERLSSSLYNSRKSNEAQTSCGCNKQIQLDTSRRYGWLLPLRSVGQDRRGYFIWELECICGKVVSRDVSKVNTGSGALHCGCRNNPSIAGSNTSLIGERFDQLLVTSYHGRDEKYRHSIWEVQCDCGNKTIKKSEYLKSPGAKNCGCLSRTGSKANHFTGHGNVRGDYFGRIKAGAIKRNLEFNITAQMIDDLYASQEGKCALSGVPIIMAKKSQQTASLDRIDSKKGYDLDNVQWVHKTINKMKLALTDEEFRTWCQKVADNTNH